MYYMFRLIIRQYSGTSTQEHIQEDTIISKGSLLIFTVSLVKMV